MAVSEEKRRSHGATRGQMTARVRTKNCGQGDVLMLRQKMARIRAKRLGVRRGIAALFSLFLSHLRVHPCDTPLHPHPLQDRWLPHNKELRRF